MGNGTQTNTRRSRRSTGRPLAGGTDEYEALVCAEDRLVILDFRGDPEIDRCSRAMEGPGHPPLASELADVTQIDEYDVLPAMQRDRPRDGQRLDLPFGGL